MSSRHHLDRPGPLDAGLDQCRWGRAASSRGHYQQCHHPARQQQSRQASPRAASTPNRQNSMGCALSATATQRCSVACQVACLPAAEAEAQAAESAFLSRMAADGAEVVKSQRVTKTSSSQSSRRFLVLRQRDCLGATLSFLDVIPSSAAGELLSGELPLTHAHVTRSSADIAVAVSAAAHPDSVHVGEAFGFGCATEEEAADWETALRKAMDAAAAQHFGVSAGFLREEYAQWQRAAYGSDESQSVEVGAWCRMTWRGGCGLSVRQDIGLTSEEIGSLGLGEELLVLQKQTLDAPNGGTIIRVRFERGWVTAEHSDGTRLLEPRGALLADYRGWLESRLLNDDEPEAHDRLLQPERRIPYTHHLVRAAAAHHEEEDSGEPLPEPAEVGPATVYVSHQDCSCVLASEFFETLLGSLGADDFAWIDLYSDNLFSGVEGGKLRARATPRCVRSCRRVLAVSNAWSLPERPAAAAESTAWSLWEIFSAIRAEQADAQGEGEEGAISLEMLWPEAQRQFFRAAVVDDAACASTRMLIDDQISTRPHQTNRLPHAGRGPAEKTIDTHDQADNEMITCIQTLIEEESRDGGVEGFNREVRARMEGEWAALLRQLASESEQRSHLALSDPDPDRAQGDKGQAAARELDWRAEFRWVFTGSGVEDPAAAAAAATLVTVDERSSDWTTRTVGKARAWLQMREAAGDLISAAEVGDFIGFQRTHAEQLEHARLCRNVGVLFRDKLRQHADALELQREGLAVDAACYGEMHPVVGQVSRLASILPFGQPASVVSVASRSRATLWLPMLLLLLASQNRSPGTKSHTHAGL